jgi:hypothetical protein
LNLIATYSNKEKFLFDGLNSSKYQEYWGSNWGFFDIASISSEFGPLIHGYLVKFKPETDEEVAIPETHKLSDEAIQNRVTAKSRFFLHIDSGLISYHPIQNKIENRTFCDRFAKLFELAYENFFVSVEIQAIVDNYKIFEELKKFKSIARVSIYLHPSNPSNREIWARTDERLKKLGATNYLEKYKANPENGGLNILDDDEVKSKISMADDGYGRADVTGEMDGVRKRISTKDNPITAPAPTDENPPELIVANLSATLKNIFSRFKS